MKGPTLRQRLERKISFLNCLFIYFYLFIYLFAIRISRFSPLTFFVIRIFPSAFAIRRYPVLVLQTPELNQTFKARSNVSLSVIWAKSVPSFLTEWTLFWNIYMFFAWIFICRLHRGHKKVSTKIGFSYQLANILMDELLCTSLFWWWVAKISPGLPS